MPVRLKIAYAEAFDSPGSPGVPGGKILGATVELVDTSDLSSHVAATNPHGTGYDSLVAATNPIKPPAFTTATRPAFGDWGGGIIYVSNATDAQKMQYSNGSAWLTFAGVVVP